MSSNVAECRYIPPAFLIAGDPALGLKPLQGLQVVLEVLEKFAEKHDPEVLTTF